jgi:hypothetical protein
MTQQCGIGEFTPLQVCHDTPEIAGSESGIVDARGVAFGPLKRLASGL